MKSLPAEDIIKFLKANVLPLSYPDYGDGYRAAVTLTDGLHLPCVVFRNPVPTVDLAIRRFEEEQPDKNGSSKSSEKGYRKIVTLFVTSGNCINSFDIAAIKTSNFAFPESILEEIDGETEMAWTGFVAQMKDGKQFAFGTPYQFEFFAMPKGYKPDDIVEIISHSYLGKNGSLQNYHSSEHSEEFDMSLVHRERPYFECYIENL